MSVRVLHVSLNVKSDLPVAPHTGATEDAPATSDAVASATSMASAASSFFGLGSSSKESKESASGSASDGADSGATAATTGGGSRMTQLRAELSELRTK